MVKVVFKSRAVDDIKVARDWYNEQSKGLGYEFINCVEDAVDNIKNNPELYPTVYKQVQRALVKRFPYSVFYLFENNIVYILSIFDNRQSPEKRP
ncbi:MAG: type II toxin-antitoxin system RelE/ParE family toxin [Gammaproteobacteria bacterium]|nr:type II toxin-antitoxin system RelE/ParE family toxin [Gammaproteobacteria bacterium]